MSRDGSGNYNLPAGNPVVTGTTISSTWANATMPDIGAALTQSLSKDGQTVPTGNLPMGGFRHTGVSDATARTQYASFGQVQDSGASYLTAVAGTNTITASLTGLAAYAAGQQFRFVAAGANTGAVTININGLGAKDITKQGTTPLVSGDIPSGIVVQIVYDGTRFQLVAVPAVLSLTGLTVSGTSTLAGTTVSGTLIQTSSSGGDFVVHTSTAAAAEVAMRITATDATSGASVKVSNSSLNKQATMRGRSDGGITFYVNQASAGGSTSGTQAADIDASGFFNAVRVSENSTRTFSRNSSSLCGGAQNYDAANKVFTFPHGLAQLPTGWQVWAVCLDGTGNTGGANYPLGHCIAISNNQSSSMCSVTFDTTNVYLRVANNIAVVDFTTPSSIVALVAGTKWSLNVRAWY